MDKFANMEYLNKKNFLNILAELGDFSDYASHLENNCDLIDEKNSILPFYPQKYSDIYKFYKEQIQQFWIASVIDLSRDSNVLDLFEQNEKKILKFILSYLSNVDGMINDNILEKMRSIFTAREAKMYYNSQIAIEDVHQVFYNDLICVIVPDPKERFDLVNCCKNYQSIQWKNSWLETLLKASNFEIEKSGNILLSVYLVALCCVEMLHLVCNFGLIHYLFRDKENYGIVVGNKYISRDEQLHGKAASYIYRTYVKNPISKEWMDKIIKQAVLIEKMYLEEMFSENNCKKKMEKEFNLMCQFLEYQADVLLTECGYTRIYNTNNPLKFMEAQEMISKSNFFETRATEYTLNVDMISADDLFN